MPQADEPFTVKELERACDDLEMMDFFPKSRASVMALLAKMCPHRRALRWLVDELVNHVPKWPGAAEVRGLLCTRFDAADGIDQPYCSIPGHTPEEAEAKYLEGHDARKQQKQIAGESAALIRQVATKAKFLQ